MSTYFKSKNIARHALLPEVIPRFQQLFASGFGWLAVLALHIFYAARLIPPEHPYLLPKNRGKFGLRHVLFEASRHITFDRKHMDQVLIYFAVLCGMILLIGQFVVIGFALVFNTAYAGLFTTPSPQADAAFMILDYVFGIPGVFGSCALGTPTGTQIFPCSAIPTFGDPPAFPFHEGLHTLLEFYSWSLLFVAILIFLYFIVIVTAETAQSGVPFGARFNTVWAPVRMLIGIGLLIPAVYGLNSGQYITLGVAKLGSSLATNAWLAYNTTIESAPGYNQPNPTGMGGKSSVTPGWSGNPHLIPKPYISDIDGFAAAMQVINACRYAYMKRFGWVGAPSGPGPGGTGASKEIVPFLVKPGDPLPRKIWDSGGYQSIDGNPATLDGAYQAAVDFYDRGDVLIRFGTVEAGNDGMVYAGTVKPYCGDIVIPTIATEPIDPGNPDAGAWAIQRQYFALALQLGWSSPWNHAHAARWGELQKIGVGPYARPCDITENDLLGGGPMGPGFSLTSPLGIAANNPPDATTPVPEGCTKPPTIDQRNALRDHHEMILNAQVESAWQELLQVNDLFTLTNEVKQRGWAAAGMWYNNVAGVIGREFSAAAALPYMSRFPHVMEEVRRLKDLEDLSVGGVEMYKPEISGDDDIKTALGASGKNYDIANLLYHVAESWQGMIGIGDFSAWGDQNVLSKVMHGIFGIESLMNIRSDENANVHPMSLLVAIGKDLVDSTLRNVMLSTGFSIGGGLASAAGWQTNAEFYNATAGGFTSIALIGLTAGFLLYYVLPFLPFLYFFFAVGTWVKTIIEAMVGVPLWALAHIRIDKEGLPGDAAANGYFLILEIFIRPILIVFGLIASFSIFGALVSIMNEIFSIVVDNLAGHQVQDLTFSIGTYTIATLEQNQRSVIDEFFFTILYTIAVYILALSTFKLIDLIPNSILRWTGAGVKSFGDTYQDPAEGLTQYAAMGGYVIGQRLLSGTQQAATGLGRAMGSPEKGGIKPPQLIPEPPPGNPGTGGG